MGDFFVEYLNFRWELMIVVLIVYTCLVLPPRIAFGDNALGPLLTLDGIFDLIFILDIFVSMNTGKNNIHFSLKCVHVRNCGKWNGGNEQECSY